MDPSAESILETLIKKGWTFKDPEEIKTLIRSSASPDHIESELLNSDLRSIGAKSLPDSSSLKKSSHLTGPKVLQLVSVRDIYHSSIDASSKIVQRCRRLLRFVLTDGHTEVTAIEFVPIPSITEEIVPGTKIRLENKVPIHSGILCLNPKAVTIMGGNVPSLYEEWQMSQKYSGFSRSSLRLSRNENGVGPPPFEKLQIEPRSYQVSHEHRSHGSMESTSRSFHMIDSKEAGFTQGHPIINEGLHPNDQKNKFVDDQKIVPSTEKSEEDKPSTSEVRPKEVSEAVPVQNQVAAQKLLQKMSQPAHGDRNPRGYKQRFKGKQEEQQVFTLEEWERIKAGSIKPTMSNHTQDVSRDEVLARQLQNQLDMEDFHEKPNYSEAEQIRMRMFSFGGPEESSEFRGRGRGRGRGRSRGGGGGGGRRGRGRGRFG